MVFYPGLMIFTKAQKVYTTTGGEMIFQMSEINRSGDHIPTNLRWTVFLHLGTNVHLDLGNAVGFYSGVAIRNVGFIMNEYNTNINNEQVLVKHIYRTYNLGVPLAIKLGSIDKNFFIFGGGEYEWLFHFKHKYWPSGNGGRSNEKTKYTEWFSNEVKSLIPSLFAGIQFPGGVNLKFKYYLQNYMNKNYVDSAGDKPYEDLNIKLFYISLSVNIRHKSIKKIWSETRDDYAYR